MLQLRRLTSGAVALWAFAGAGAEAQQPGAPAGTRMVQLDGHPVRVLASGLENRRKASPVVVFEAGITNRLEVWDSVLPQVASLAPVVAYDRAGVGLSEWDNQMPSPQHVADRLRRLLEQIGAAPPYVLVGYSWGGILARYFAGYHPADVAGLVFVDPGPLVTASLADQLAPFEAVGAGRAGYDAYWSGFAALFKQASPAVRAEFDVLRGLMEMDVAQRDLRPVPDVPVVVIVAAKYLPPPPVMQLPYDPKAHFDVELRQRISTLEEWALTSPQGTLVVSNRATHAITREDPNLVVWAVKRVLDAPARH